MAAVRELVNDAIVKCMNCRQYFDISDVPDGYRPLCPNCKLVRDYVTLTEAETYDADKSRYAGKRTQSGLAIFSLVMGIVSIFVYVLPLGLFAVISGWIAIHKIRKDEHLEGKGLAIAGIITGALGLAIFLMIALIILLAIIS